MNIRETAAAGEAKLRVPFNDLAFQWREVADAVRGDFDAIFEQSAFCLGPYADAFEKEVAAYLDVPHAIAVNTGTSALHLAVIAAGLRPGDEVLVPDHTFIATVWGPLYAGVNPVLCDVDPETGNLDWDDAAARITPRTKAVIPVHLYGQPVDMDRALAFATQHGLVLIEDVAQAIGARFDGRMLGGFGTFGCFSFYPGKNLGAAGEGGLVVTADADKAARLRSLRNHGQSRRYVHEEVGFNYRMDGLQAAVLSRKLARLDGWTDRRRAIAGRYLAGLAGLPLQLPVVSTGDHVWHLFVVKTPLREGLKNHLAEAGIDTGLHYPVPNHRQPALARLAPADGRPFPESERWADQCLSLPLFYGMTDAQADHVVTGVRRFFETR